MISITMICIANTRELRRHASVGLCLLQLPPFKTSQSKNRHYLHSWCLKRRAERKEVTCFHSLHTLGEISAQAAVIWLQDHGQRHCLATDPV